MPETLRSWANGLAGGSWCGWWRMCASTRCNCRSEEHTSELQSRLHLVCRLLLEKIKRVEDSVQSDDDGRGMSLDHAGQLPGRSLVLVDGLGQLSIGPAPANLHFVFRLLQSEVGD